MGTLTLSQFITEVTAGLGNRTDNQLTQTRYINALNIAQQRIGRFYNWQEMNSIYLTVGTISGVAASDKFLPMPSGLKTVHSLIIQDGANSQKLVEKPWRMFDKNVPLPEYIAPSWPYYYTRFSPTLAMLFPIPLLSFTYFLRATVFATPFTASNLTAVSDFADKDDIVIDWALEYLFRLLGRPDLAQGYDHMALERCKEAKATSEDRPDMNAEIDNMASGGNQGPYWANAFVKSVPVDGSY